MAFHRNDTTNGPPFSDFPTDALEFVDAELALLADECRQATLGGPVRVGSNIITGLRIYVQLALQRRKEPPEPTATADHLERRYCLWSSQVDRARVRYEGCGCEACYASLKFTETSAASIWAEMRGDR